MQWETKVTFSGQLKPVGIEKSMSWKLGSVNFDFDAVSCSWMVKLYFKVNPTKVWHQMKINQSDSLDVKCGRLMIENKKGDGIHMKLSNNDIAKAKVLVSKIKSSTVLTPTGSKAVVGLTSIPALSSPMGSENISPSKSEDFCDLSLFQSNNISPEHQVGGWLSKKTSPMKNREYNPPPKRRLELFSPEKDRRQFGIKERDKNGEHLSSFHSFTGMKDYSKRNRHGGDSLSVTGGHGPKSFYGAHNSITTNPHRSILSNNSSRHLDRSPALKRLRLMSSPLTSQGNRMSDSRLVESTSSSPGALESNTRPKESPLTKAEVSKLRHRATESIGFQNLGNTCFLNSPLQCLSFLEPLSLDIQSAIAKYGTELNRNSLTRKLYLLMKDVRKLDACPEHVKDILMRLRTDMSVKFALNTQQDAHEFLSELLNRLDEEVRSAVRLHASNIPRQLTQDSMILVTGQEEGQAVLPSGDDAAAPLPSSPPISTPTEANFCWSYKTWIMFNECKTEVKSPHTEHETTLMLAFDSNTQSLQDCIKKYFESTTVDMKCERCLKDEKATITRKIVKLPRVFILNLLRYQSDITKSAKKADHICVPSYISIYEYCAEDVKKPLHVDPVFMLDRDSNIDFSWLDNEEMCRCVGENLPSGSGPSSYHQDDHLSRETDELGRVLSDMADLEQNIHGSARTSIARRLLSSTDTLCKNDASKTLRSHEAFVSLSITKRTSIYPQNRMGVDGEHEKPKPFSKPFSRFYSGTKYLSSFLTEGVGVGSKSPKSLTRTSSLAASVADKGDHLGYSLPTPRVHDRPALLIGNRPLVHNDDQPDFSVDPDRQSLLADFVSSSLHAIDGYLELAQKKGVDLGALCEDAQATISKIMASIEHDELSPERTNDKAKKSLVPHHKMLVSELLLKKALELDESQLDYSHDDALRQIIEDLVIERYDHLGRCEQTVDYLIEDLGLFISAMDCGLLNFENFEQKESTKYLPAVEKRLSYGHAQSEVSFQQEPRNPEGESRVKVTATNFLQTYLRDGTAPAPLKKTVSFRHHVDNIVNEFSLDRKPISRIDQVVDSLMKQDGRKIFGHDRDSPPIYVENLWDDNWEMGNDNQRDNLAGDASTGYLTSQMLHGKDISFYTEADLLKVDHGSMNEDEMMVYAQALSRFEYEKEQAAQVVAKSIGTDVLMDASNPEPGIETTIEVADQSTSGTPSGQGHFLNATANVSQENASRRNSDTSSVKTESSIPTPARFPSFESKQESEMDKSDSGLICQEYLSDLDEGDGCGPDYIQSSEPVIEPISVLSSTEPGISCGSISTASDALDQAETEFESLDMVCLPAMQTNSIEEPDKPIEEPTHGKLFTPKTVVESPNQSISIDGSDLSVKSEATTSAHNPEKKTVEESAERIINLEPQPNQCGAKTNLFSPSKNSNLVKTRDYARLKSPAVSPKKRSAKGQQSKSVCVSKRLHFSEEEKAEQMDKSSQDGLSSEESNNSDLHDTSVEVNVDDVSFLDNINSCSFVDTSALSISYSTPLSAPKLNTIVPATLSKCMASSTDEPNPASMSLAAEEHSLHAPQVNQVLDMQIDQFDTSAHSRDKNIVSETIQEMVNESENSPGSKPKTNTMVATLASSTEEKENVQDLSKSNRVQNMELEKTDLSYKLVGLVDHTGTSQFTGHYTAYSFNMRKQKWFHLNDTETQAVTEEEVQEKNTQTGYLFFYMDKDLFNDYREQANAGSQATKLT